MISLPIFRGAVSNAADVPSLDLNFSGPSGFFAAKGATPTLTRGSVATYTDSAGVLRTTNSNLLTYSEDFGDASWVKSALTTVLNTSVSPSGTLTADQFTENAALSNHILYKGYIASLVSGSAYTVSIYFKKPVLVNDKRYVYVSNMMGPTGSIRYSINIDLQLGVVNSSTTMGSPTGTSHKIESVGSYWRISATMTAPSTSDVYIIAGLSQAVPTWNGNAESFYTGDGVSSMTVWGAQIEQASYAGPYSPTTTVVTNDGPRIDYDPVTLACKGLLIEEARTNLFLQSNNFTDAYWSKAQVTLANAVGVNSPDGSANATLITATNAAADGVYRMLSGPVGGTYSIYIKRNVGSYFSIWSSSDDSSACRFNILTNTIVSLGVNNESASVTPINNGWVRLSVIRKASAASSNSCFFAFLGPAGAPVATVGDNHYIYGAQLEVGTFPTSYIPTTTATVTRNVESCYLNGTNFSSWFNGTEGTFIVDFRVGVVSPSYTTILVASDGGTLTNNIRLVHQSLITADVWTGSSVIASSPNTSYSIDTLYKSAIAYKVNDFAFCLDSEAVSVDTAGAVPTGINQLVLASGYSAGGGTTNTKITLSRVRYYNKRLANSRLQQRTSPTILDWRSVGPVHWPNYKASITNTIATATVADVTTTPGGTYAATTNKLVGGLLLPDGRVFCVPFGQVSAVIYDPVSNSISTTANISTGVANTLGAVLLKNGNIYLIGSSNGSKGFEYNYTTGAITTPAGANTSPTTGEVYSSGVLMPDGRVFLIPGSATVARIYNPFTQTLESPSITNGTFASGVAKYSGGVLLNDGNVFLVPRNETVGKTYNPITNTITNSSNTLPVGEKYFGGVLLPDGRVFCVPLTTTVAKIFNPVTNSFEADITGFGSGFLGSVLLPDGNVFCVPFSATSPKIYNPTTGSISTAAGSYGLTYGWAGGVLLNDGRVFCVPHASTTARIYGGGSSFNNNVILSAYYNKL